MFKLEKQLLPCIVSALRVISSVIEKSPEVNEDWAWSVRGNQVSLHFLWRSIGWNNDGTLLQTNMILLSKSLDQCSTSQQWKNSTLNSLFFLEMSIQLLHIQLLSKMEVKALKGKIAHNEKHDEHGHSPDSGSMMQNHAEQQRSDLHHQSYSRRAICLKYIGLHSSSPVVT